MPSPFHSAPFRQFLPGTSVAASNVSASGALPRPSREQTVVVSNPGTTNAHFRFGQGSAPTAVGTDATILPGGQRVFQALDTDTHWAVILDSSTATIVVECGDGTVVR